MRRCRGAADRRDAPRSVGMIADTSRSDLGWRWPELEA
jgi:hypothetical protein